MAFLKIFLELSIIKSDFFGDNVSFIFGKIEVLFSLSFINILLFFLVLLIVGSHLTNYSLNNIFNYIW